MRISVAMCTYNGERFLREQLQSLAAQTRLPDELVVCDDCSSDRTVEIVQEFARAARFPVRLFVNERNLRVIKNFEKAISLCEGDIIALSDQDDVWHEDKLKVFVEIFEAQPEAGLIFCDADLVDEDLRGRGIGNWDVSNLDRATRELFTNKNNLEKSFVRLLTRPVVWGCMMAFRAEYKDLVLPIPTDISGVLHDWWMSLLIYAASSLEPVPQRLVKYRQHSAQQYGQELIESNQRRATVIEKANYKSDYREQIERMKPLLERLKSKAERFEAADSIKFLESRLRHCTRRQQIQHGGVSRAERMRFIAEDLFALRYHRHSSGLKSVLKDLLLQTKQ